MARRRHGEQGSLVIAVPHPKTVFTAAIFVAAALLSFVAMTFAQMVLPALGDAPAAWKMCLAFCQTTFLAGCVYAYLSSRWLDTRRQTTLHLLLLCAAWICLPVTIANRGTPPTDAAPIAWLWTTASLTVGLQFLAISASLPMLQAWFHRTKGRKAHDPFFLIAAGGLGGLLAALVYPPAIAPYWTLGEQSVGWAFGYAAFMLLVVACVLPMRRSLPAARVNEVAPSNGAAKPSNQPPTLQRRLHWLLLAMVPSSLLMSVATYLSTGVGPTSLLWALPLAIYFLTFAMAFERGANLQLPGLTQAEPLLILAAVASLAWAPVTTLELLLTGSIQLAAFAVVTMVCHGQLAADRPAGCRLTEFYLWSSLGMAIGGLFTALAGPWILAGAAVYPLMLVIACLLRPREATARPNLWVRLLPWPVLAFVVWLLWMRQSQFAAMEWHFSDLPIAKLAVVLVAAVAAFLLRHRVLSLAAGTAVLAAVVLLYSPERASLTFADATFFGDVRVTEDPLWNARILRSGPTLLGSQSLEPTERDAPWGYYHREGPLGQLFEALRPQRPLNEIGILGLGNGAIAAYGKGGEKMTFYEINPAVAAVAKDPKCFTYLADSRAKTQVLVGEPRQLLADDTAKRFDLLVIDVSGSDTAPLHWLTREAFAVFRRRLAKHGLLVVHASNRYLNLEPILGRLADDAGLAAFVAADDDSKESYRKMPSTWIAMTRHIEDLKPLIQSPDWRTLPTDGGKIWTDDACSAIDALDWKFHRDAFSLASWWRANPARIDFHRSAGDSLYNKNQLAEALKHFQKIEELAPDDSEAQNSIGLVLLKQGKNTESIPHFEKAIALQPDFADAHCNLGIATLATGNVDGAIPHLEKSLQLSPDSFETRYHLGLALFQQNNLEEAIPHFQNAVLLNPASVETYDYLGSILLRLGEWQQAIAQFRAALELDPDDSDAREGLGDALAGVGQLEDAVVMYRKVLANVPNRAQAHNKLGFALASQNHADEAIASYRKAIELAPDFAEAHDNLGNAFQKTGKLNDAVAEYEKSLKSNPRQAKVHLHWGLTLELQGKFAEAVTHYQKALEIAPQHLTALNNLAWLLATCPDAAVRNGAKAVELAERAVNMSEDDNPGLLDTLAAAYAEAGRFSEATETSRKAIPVAAERGDARLTESLKKRLALYKAEKPFRDAAPTTSP